MNAGFPHSAISVDTEFGARLILFKKCRINLHCMNAAELRSNLHNLIDTINDGKTLKAVYALIAQ